MSLQQAHFNPRSPHGERREEFCYFVRVRHFNPRSPHGERPLELHCPGESLTISTHAPRTGSDRCVGACYAELKHFNPRSPHGERPIAPQAPGAFRRFQPTLPARGATRTLNNQIARAFISTHAPRTGSDFRRVLRQKCVRISTHAPRTGSDRPLDPFAGRPALISTHAPRTGSDQPDIAVCVNRLISTHAPRTGSDSAK